MESSPLKSSKALECIEVDSSRPALFKTALIVFGDTPASFVISLYVSPFSANAMMRDSFCFLSIALHNMVLQRFSFCYLVLLCDIGALFLVISCIRLLSKCAQFTFITLISDLRPQKRMK